MIKKKNLIGLKKTLILTLIIGAILTGCKDDCIKGEGAIETRALSVADFTGVDLASSFQVTISQGATQEVKAIGHENIIDKISASVENGLLELSLEGNKCYEDFQLSIEITTPDINNIKIRGSGKIQVYDFDNQSGLTTTIEGSGKIVLNKFEGITRHEVDIIGSGSFTANDEISTLNSLDIMLSGSGRYLGFKVSCDTATVNLSGSGKIELTVRSALDVSINGSGYVYYKGSPNSIKKTGRGSELNNAN